MSIWIGYTEDMNSIAVAISAVGLVLTTFTFDILKAPDTVGKMSKTSILT